ncbi:alcohol dehydrogenase catalytic domain-containing protein [Bosea robiniae]|uniref:alcohol dehydrogenase catalytic domain-containing protein n=1 Tax=Bosea robiniae TaxID=1036780 RepID=UPI001FCCE542|nr:alcohol dehydrogenase catalytic domain-containing protein [Bosea robiniae]
MGDVVIKVAACAIRSSDLHVYDRYTPTMEVSDVLGHETMGEEVEAGCGVQNLKGGNRVPVRQELRDRRRQEHQETTDQAQCPLHFSRIAAPLWRQSL